MLRIARNVSTSAVATASEARTLGGWDVQPLDDLGRVEASSHQGVGAAQRAQRQHHVRHHGQRAVLHHQLA